MVAEDCEDWVGSCIWSLGGSRCEVCSQDQGRVKFVMWLSRGYFCEGATKTETFSSKGEKSGR